jgi:chromate reductase, NAD(P)H dehydrogenase (quinone)
MATFQIAAICGSLRQASYNRMALKAAIELAPAELKIEIVEIRDVPLFDGDVFAKGFPASVTALREKIRAADGILFAAPEYNYSMTGVLKNAIDWASRGTDQPFNEKPVAIVSATQGPLGGARSQYDLRKVMLFVNALTLIKPEIFIGTAQNKFDANGKLTDEPTRKILGDQMIAFRDWIARLKR